MTPKEKAEELFGIYLIYTENQTLAKKCALIAVDEILDIIDTIYDYDMESLNPYWKEVKQEIEKL